MKTCVTIGALLVVGALFTLAAMRVPGDKIGDADRHYVTTSHATAIPAAQWFRMRDGGVDK